MMSAMSEIIRLHAQKNLKFEPSEILYKLMLTAIEIQHKHMNVL